MRVVIAPTLNAAALALLAAALGGCSGCRDEEPSKSEPASSAADAAHAAADTDAGSAAPTASGPGSEMAPPSAAVEAIINPNHMPAYTGPVGSLEGTITVSGDPAPATAVDFAKCPAGEKVYGKRFREGPAMADGRRPLADALVVVTGYAGFIVPERAAAKEVSIEDCAYSQRTIDLTFGQRIDVRNRDKRLYAPELANSPMPALMVVPPAADPVRLYPRRPGYTTLDERMGASFIYADVYALLQPLHTVSRVDGRYRVDGIPAGKMTVNVRLRAINHDVSQSVDIVAGGVTQADLTLEYHATRANDAGAGKIGPRPPTIK